MSEEWLIYALGNGWGHLTRALSLGRIAAKKHRIRIITNSPYIHKINHEGCLFQIIPENLSFNQTCEYIKEILQQQNYHRLVIDTFPRGLGGELADILPQLQHIPRILIHRDIDPHYVKVKNLKSFVRDNFDLVIVPGEGKDLPLSDLPQIQYTDPWLIRNAEELPDKNQVRSHIFHLEENIPIILVCASGQTSELPIFSQLAQKLQQNFTHCAVKILAPNCPHGLEKLWISHHPGIECIAAADIVISSAGYNTVYECTSLGVPLVALALKRLYDRQAKRAKKSYWVQNIDQAIATVKILLNRVSPVTQLSYPNGVLAALHLIEKI
ncbi:MAG TPA: glycosyltransferase [Nostocaceae cyanobacterium]|nr:glycosyltransferase [Nostocaceae cyanobacterium]